MYLYNKLMLSPSGFAGVVVEGKISCEHGVEDNSARPDIDRGTNVCTFGDDQLWCGRNKDYHNLSA